MGGRFGPLRDVELGAGYRVVRQLGTKHRYAYYDEDRSRLVITRADGSDTVEVAMEEAGVEWAPDGRSLFAADAQVVQIDADSGACTTLTNLPSKRYPSSLSPSPDGRTLAFNTRTVEREGRVADSGLYVPGVESRALALLDLETGELSERHDGLDVLGINVCWTTRRVAIELRRPAPHQDVSIVDLDTGEPVKTVPWRSPWRKEGLARCESLWCDWHRRPGLSDAELDSLSPGPNWPVSSVHSSKVAYIMNDAELRLANRDALGQSALVMRTRGCQFTFEQRMDMRGWVRWSADGQLIRGAIAKWTRKSKLTEKDKDSINELLRVSGLSHGPRTPQQLARATHHFTERQRFSDRIYHFIIDMNSGDIQFVTGRHDLHFSPHPLR